MSTCFRPHPGDARRRRKKGVSHAWDIVLRFCVGRPARWAPREDFFSVDVGGGKSGKGKCLGWDAGYLCVWILCVVGGRLIYRKK